MIILGYMIFTKFYPLVKPTLLPTFTQFYPTGFTQWVKRTVPTLSRLAPPTNLVNWNKRSEPLFERSLGLSVGDLSVKLWTLTSPDVAVKARL